VGGTSIPTEFKHFFASFIYYKKQEAAMTHYDHYDVQESFEYHGNTAIERTRKKNGRIRREWIFFDSIEEAVAFFNDYCTSCEAA
jgi:hypothetical protein